MPSPFVSVPGTENSGYVDWSKNLMPLIQNFVDVQKYKMQKEDALNTAALPYLISAGLVSPGKNFASNPAFARMGLEATPTTGGDNPIAALKRAELEKALLGVEETKWDIKKKKGEFEPLDKEWQPFFKTQGGVQYGYNPQKQKQQGFTFPWQKSAPVQAVPQEVMQMKMQVKAQKAMALLQQMGVQKITPEILDQAMQQLDAIGVGG